MKGQRFLVIIAICVLLLPIIMYLAPEVQGGEPVFQASIKVIPEDRSRNQQTPMDILVDNDGRVSMIYQTNEMFFWDVYIVHSYDDGITWTEPIRVDDTLRDGNESNDESTQWKPSMVLGPDGAIHVVWEDRRGYKKDDQLFTEPIRIRYSRTVDGINFSPSIEITPTKEVNTWHAYNPDLAINEEGDMVCVWEDKKDAGAYKNIWSSYSTDNGGNWSEPVMLNSDGRIYRDHFYPQVAMYGDNVYATWHDDRNITIGTKPYMAISRDGGQTFGHDFPLSTDTGGEAVRDNAYPVVDDEGNLYVAWHDGRTGTDEIFFRRSEDHGMTFSKDDRLFPLPPEMSDMFPHLAASGNGNISLVWERHKPFDYRSGTYTEADIYYMNSSDGGRSWTDKLMVDDTDRYGEDRTDQRWVLSTFNNNGRALCVWMDSREEAIGASDFDLYFSRHSNSLSQMNDLPEIHQVRFEGDYGFDRTIGNSTTLFNFSCVYKDEQNDAPGEGYPRMQVFRDPEGGDPLLPDWLPMKRTLGPADIYFIDGVSYHKEISIPEEGDFYFRIRVNDGVAPDIVTSPVVRGPVIDLTMPTVEMTEPVEKEWIAQERVRCSAVISDRGGAGIRNNTIGYVKSVNGPDNFEDPQKAGGFLKIDNDTYEAWAMVRFDPGMKNYVKFVAKDRVGNGYAESEALNLWIDYDAPYATAPKPKAREVKIYPLVNCSITWRDNNPGSTLFNFTGVDPDSIRYAYRTTSTGFSEWLKPDGYTATGPESYRAWAFVNFPDEGMYNSIKWKAEDLVGNMGESPSYGITVDVPDNYRPVFVGKGYPGIISSPTPHLWWDPAYDEEGDPLTYKVMLLKHPSELILTDWIDLGPRRYFDIPDDQALEPNFYILRINVTDGIGGWDIYDHIFRIIDTGPPPPERVPRPDPFYMTTPGIVEWERSPDDTGQAVYLIRIGSRSGLGDILEWYEVGETTEYDLRSLDPDLGIYSLQIMCFNDGNYSRVTHAIIKISDYKPETVHPDHHAAYKGVEGIRITEPMFCHIKNNGTFGDNVTVRIKGEIVDKGYAFLNSSGESYDTYFVEAARLKAEDSLFEFIISIQPEDNARTGSYTLTYTVTSEDGVTRIDSGSIEVRVKNPPDQSGGDNIADDLSDMITDVLPFLGGLPTGFIIGIFLLMVIGIIAALVAVGILLTRSSARKKKDPLKEQKRVYKEIYGREPTEEELSAMVMAGQEQKEDSVEEFIGKGAPEEAGENTEEVSQETEGGKEEKPVATESGQTMPLEGTDDDTGSGDEETDELLEKLFD
ncbi:MAG: hypothetical protein R6V01_05600 [Thermoplasmatota archaeon]